MNKIEKLDLFTIKVFLEIYEKRTGIAAAKALNTTQPKVSRSLGTLRETFDDVLFNRHQYGLEPNHMADQLYPLIKGVASSYNSLVSQVTRRASDGETINICAQEQFSDAFVAAVHHSYGHKATVVTHPWSDDVDKHLSKSMVDFCISVNPEPRSGISDYKIGPVNRYFAVARRDHPLFDSEFSVDSVLNYPMGLFAYPMSSGREHHFLKYVEQHNLSLNLSLRTSSASTLFSHIKCSDCLTIVAGMPLFIMIADDPELQMIDVTDYWKSTIIPNGHERIIDYYLRARDSVPERKCLSMVEFLRGKLKTAEQRCLQFFST